MKALTILLLIILLSSCKDGVQKNLEVHFKDGNVDTLSVMTYNYFIDAKGVLYIAPNQIRSANQIAHDVKYVKEVSL